MFALQCDCGSFELEHDGIEFTCTECGRVYSEKEAGKNLIDVES